MTQAEIAQGNATPRRKEDVLKPYRQPILTKGVLLSAVTASPGISGNNNKPLP
jgi:hypothetical protein